MIIHFHFQYARMKMNNISPCGGLNTVLIRTDTLIDTTHTDLFRESFNMITRKASTQIMGVHKSPVIQSLSTIHVFL